MVLPDRNAKDGKERDAKRVEIRMRNDPNETIQLVYTRDNFLRPGSSRQFILSNVRQKVQQDAYGENQHTVIKGMWFGCKLSDTFNDVYKNKRRLTIHERRMKGRVFLGGEVVDERGDIVIAKVLEKTVDEESA